MVHAGNVIVSELCYTAPMKCEPQQWVPAFRIFWEILATPTDTTVLDDLRSTVSESLIDPWQR